jgi:cell division protein FtsL
MKRSRKSRILSETTRFVVDTLTGRKGVGMMVAGYCACAVMLLGYVSTQVYTYSLMEDIYDRERQQRTLKESVGLQTERFAELSSRERIVRICETKLGMVPAATDQLQRVAVDSNWSPGGEQSEFEGESVNLPEMMGRNINELTEVIRR